MRLTQRQALLSWLAISACTAVVLGAVWPQVGVPRRSSIEMALLAVSYSTTLARCAYVGLQGSWLREELRRSNDQLLAFSQRIDRMARYDELTGLMNRRSIRALLEDHAALAVRGMEGLSVALLDLDHFKTVNDRFGHADGDHVLCEFGALAATAMRVTDHVGRFGGEEFLFLLPGTTANDAHRAMERIRAVVARHDRTIVAPGLTVTASIGLATLQSEQSVADLLRQTDDALYTAKRAGRARVARAA